MAWFLALQGPAHITNQSSTYELDDSVNVKKIAEELTSSATLDRVVPIPAVFQHPPRKVTVYVRPAAWGAWMFYELSEEERRQLPSGNALIEALAQAARQQAGTDRPQSRGGPAGDPD